MTGNREGLQIMRAVLSIGLIAVLACCEPQGSCSFVTTGGVRVFPVSGSVFEVAPPAGSEVQAFWCGAGQYARWELEAADAASVYVVSGVGPGAVSGSRSAVQYSLLPPGTAPGAAGRAGSWGPQLGASATVRSARKACGQRRRSED